MHRPAPQHASLRILPLVLAIAAALDARAQQAPAATDQPSAQAAPAAASEPATPATPAASSDQAAQPASAKPGTDAPLAPVVVSATRTPRVQLDVPASVDLVTSDQIRDAQARVNLSESLVRVPGLVILNRQNYAQDLQLSIRGFGARSTFGERGVRLYVDGVPATFPDGQGQVSHFPLNAVDHIEVLRGPFSALYGNSSGGVISLTTDLKPQPIVLEPSVAYGSYNTSRLGFNGKGGQDTSAFNVDVERFRTDGYRTHDNARKDQFNVRAALLDTPLGQLRLSLNAVDLPASQDAMGLTKAQYLANPSAASPVALQFNTRKTTRQDTVGADLQSAVGPGRLSTAVWLGSRYVIQYQAIPVATQTGANATTSPGGIIEFNRDFGGTDLRYTLDAGPLTASAGIDAEEMKEHRRGYNNFIGTGASQVLGVIGALKRDENNTVSSVDPYLQGEWRIADQWIADAGVRSVHVRVKSQDHYLANGDDSSSLSYSGTVPSAGLVFRATQRFSVYASYARGFETPTLNELAYRSDGSAGLNTKLLPSRSNNVELGVKGVMSPALHYSLAAFRIATSNDLVVQTNSGGRSTYSNVGRTRRDGEEFSLDWAFAPQWSTAVSLATVNARFDTGFLTCVAAPCTTPTLPVAAGNKLPGVPARTAFVELKYKGWADVSLQGRASSRIYVDDRNTDHALGYGTVNLAAAHTFAAGSYKPRVFARVDNVFDRRYVGSVIVNESNSRYFEPAAPRTWLVGVDLPL